MAVDFPRAWEITKSVQSEYHHNRCSFNTAGMLCDCDVLYQHPETLDTETFYGAGGKVISSQREGADK